MLEIVHVSGEALHSATADQHAFGWEDGGRGGCTTLDTQGHSLRAGDPQTPSSRGLSRKKWKSDTYTKFTGTCAHLDADIVTLEFTAAQTDVNGTHNHTQAKTQDRQDRLEALLQSSTNQLQEEVPNQMCRIMFIGICTFI